MKNSDNKQLFDANWNRWNITNLLGPASRWRRRLILDNLSKLQAAPIKTIVDVGCGEGQTTYDIAILFNESNVIGCDFSSTGINFAQSNFKRDNLQYVIGNAQDINANAELVCCFECLEHIEDWQGTINNLISGGGQYMAISVPTGRMRKSEINVGHLRNFKRGEIESYLELQGYRAISIAYAGFPFYSPIYREICNIGDFGSPKENISTEFGFFRQMLSKILFVMFYHLSSKSKKGDQFIGIFEKVNFQETKGDKFNNDRM